MSKTVNQLPHTFAQNGRSRRLVIARISRRAPLGVAPSYPSRRLLFETSSTTPFEHLRASTQRMQLLMTPTPRRPPICDHESRGRALRLELCVICRQPCRPFPSQREPIQLRRHAGGGTLSFVQNCVSTRAPEARARPASTLGVAH